MPPQFDSMADQVQIASGRPFALISFPGFGVEDFTLAHRTRDQLLQGVALGSVESLCDGSSESGSGEPDRMCARQTVS